MVLGGGHRIDLREGGCHRGWHRRGCLKGGSNGAYVCGLGRGCFLAVTVWLQDARGAAAAALVASGGNRSSCSSSSGSSSAHQ